MSQKKYVLVTGGLGYIGSHAVAELINQNFTPVIIDNLSNSDQSTLKNLENLTKTKIFFFDQDIRNFDFIKLIFSKFDFYAVMHFAGLKSISESFIRKDEYNEINVLGTKNLVREMLENNVSRFIFSSSATVYGQPLKLPIDENEPLKSTNPYGQNKIDVENYLKDLSINNKNISTICLRYFNPVGAHKSGMIGENPLGKPNNIMPLICNVACGESELLYVYGDDYETDDGTGIRDYIHVTDLVLGHISALNYCDKFNGYLALNLGTGYGVSVKELITKFENVNHIQIPYVLTKRREGDVAKVFANPKMAKKILGWKAKLSLEDMVKDSWNWNYLRKLNT